MSIAASLQQASMPRASLRSVLVAIGTFILGFALHAVSRPLFDAAVRDVGTSSPLDALFVNSVRVKQLNPTSNLGAGAAFQYNTMHRERSSTETAVIPAAAEGRFQQDAYAAAQTTRVCAFGSGLVKKCEKVCVVPSCPVSNAKPNGEEVSHKQRCAMRMDGCCEFTCVDDEIRVRPVDASTVPLSSHSCYGAGVHVEPASTPTGIPPWLKSTCRYTSVCWVPNWKSTTYGRHAPRESEGIREGHFWGSGDGTLVYIAEDEEEVSALKKSGALDVLLSPLNARLQVKPSSWASKLAPHPMTRAEFSTVLRESSETLDREGEWEWGWTETNGKRERKRVRREGGGGGLPSPTAATATTLPAASVKRMLPFATGLHILYSSFNAENFGHFLTDELLPAFAAMEAFGVETRDVQLLRAPIAAPHMLVFSCEWQRLTWGEVQWEKCLKRYSEMTSLLSDRPVRTFETYAREASASFAASKHLIQRSGDAVGARGVVCFDELIAGFGMLADHCDDPTAHGRKLDYAMCNVGRTMQYWRFRAWMIASLDVKEVVPAPPKIMVWDRDVTDYKPERKIFELERLCAEIQIRFANQHVECERFVKWTGVPIETQVSKMANAQIFVTGPGAGSHVGWFLPRGATMLRIYPANWMLEHHLFPFLSHMHVEHIDARNGSKGRGYFDHDQVLELVGQALRRYAHSAPVRAAKAAAASDASAATSSTPSASTRSSLRVGKGSAATRRRLSSAVPSPAAFMWDSLTVAPSVTRSSSLVVVEAEEEAAAEDARKRRAAPVDNVRAYGLIEVDEVKGLAQACERGTFNTLRDQCEQSPAKEDCLRHRVGTFCRGQYAGRD